MFDVFDIINSQQTRRMDSISDKNVRRHCEDITWV
jgi:hypothetical protein